LQGGNFLNARGLWAEAARRAPEGSDARKMIESRIARLDAVVQQLMKIQQAQPQPSQPHP